MKYFKLSTLLLLIIFTTACSTLEVKTNATAFYVAEFKSTGSIFILSADAEKNNSLEFAHYKQKIEDKLVVAGYSIAANADVAEYIAIVAYGIDNGKTSVISTPIFSSPNALYGGRLSSNPHRPYMMPSYSVVGTSTDSFTTYTRAIALDIVDAKSLKTVTIEQAQKVYESRVKSTGKCAVIAGVFDQLLEAMFQNFPGDNGKTITAAIPYDGQCD